MKIDLSELVSIPEAAKMRGVSTQAIQHLMKLGRFTIIEISGRKFLLRKEVEAFKPGVAGRPRKDKSLQGSKTTKGSASKTKPSKKSRAD